MNATVQQQQRCSGIQQQSSRCRKSVVPKALFGRKSATAVVEKTTTTSSKKTARSERKESFISQTINAFDFAEARSAKDADLLWEAKYGKRGEDGKMTREQYAALRRKVGGTAKSFFKEYIEEEQVKIKPYSKPGSAAAVPYLPFLVGVVVAMLAATVVVVEKTA